MKTHDDLATELAHCVTLSRLSPDGQWLSTSMMRDVITSQIFSQVDDMELDALALMMDRLLSEIKAND